MHSILGWKVPGTAVRRVLGVCWLVAWCTALYGAAAPWRALGGAADERARWTAWAASLAAAVAGFAVGSLARHIGVETGRVTHRGMLRALVLPGGATAAVACAALAVAGMEDGVRVVVQAGLAAWAGLDLAYGAVPLMDGEPYAFARPLPPPPPDWPTDDAAPWDGGSAPGDDRRLL